MYKVALEYNHRNRDGTLESLKEFLRIPSVGTETQHKADVHRACDFIANQFRALNLQGVELIPGEGNEHPLVIAEWKGAPGKPTVLCYGHIDVVPTGALDLWQTPPFEPSVRDGKVFARGSTDDKGHVWMMLKAVEAYLKTSNALPVNIKFLVEAEEEFSSAHIARYLNSKPDFLKEVTSVVILDGTMFAPNLPTVATGLRGPIMSEIIVRGTSRDLHSGEHGGTAPNALQIVADIASSLKTPGGRVRIPGFYRGIKRTSRFELASWRSLPFDDNAYRLEIGAKQLIGDAYRSVHERLWSRPALDINGFAGGYGGPGIFSVIPAEARAKVSMRLVPGQDPSVIAESYRQFVAKLTPSCVESEVRIMTKFKPVLTDPRAPAIEAAARAIEAAFGRAPVFTRHGGSIPPAALFNEHLGVPLFMSSFGQSDSRLHSPNENLDLDCLYKGIDTMILYFHELGKAA